MHMEILMITHFTQIPGESGNERFGYIAEKLVNRGHSVEVITTDFSHHTKKYRTIEKGQLQNCKYKLVLLHEPSYKKNVSISRVIAHYVFSKNVKTYLKKRRKPDVIYCSVPSLSIGTVTCRIAKKRNIRLIIDIQDLWPEAFEIKVKNEIIRKILFGPLKIKADYIYKNADDIIAVSETYLKRAVDVNSKVDQYASVFLGTDLLNFDSIVNTKKIIKKKNNFIIVYIGKLGISYDLKLIIDAIYVLSKQGYDKIEFLIMGDGELKEEFTNYALEKNVKAIFTGRLEYIEMVARLKKCDLAVNPIIKGAAQSIINKVGDYAAASLPVINTQSSKEYSTLVKKYYIGYNCNPNDAYDVAEHIKKLLLNPSLRKQMGINNRKLAEKKFNRVYTYNKIIEIVETE